MRPPSAARASPAGYQRVDPHPPPQPSGIPFRSHPHGGLGTIGLLLAMFLREAGVGRVLAIGNKDFQRREAVGMGLPEDCFFNSRGGPPVPPGAQIAVGPAKLVPPPSAARASPAGYQRGK